MCCIFTWLAWTFDAMHRAVVFFMACLISFSVCCLLFTASLAGVAMGYNYSLAEYIDLKETNISVYVKRGVYDDEIADDFDWRRSAGSEPNMQLRDANSNLIEGGQPIALSGRRRADSVFESDEHNKYEGSLMKLTSMGPGPIPGRRFQPEPPYSTSTKRTSEIVDGLLAVADNLPGGSLDRLKAIQAAARHHEAQKIELATAQFPEGASERVKAIQANAQIHDARRSDRSSTTDKYAKYFNQLMHHPGFPGSGLNGRKFMEKQEKDMVTSTPNRFRDAVFRGQLGGWPTSTPTTTGNFFEYDKLNTLDMHTWTPPTVKPQVVQPGRGLWETTPGAMRPILRGIGAKDIVYDSNSPKKPKGDLTKWQNDNDYEESQGLPKRKKRSIDDNFKHELVGNIALLNTAIEFEKQHDLHAENSEPETKDSDSSNLDDDDDDGDEDYTESTLKTYELPKGTDNFKNINITDTLIHYIVDQYFLRKQ